MSRQHPNGSTTLPRGFRFHYNEGECPVTPEPVNAEEQLQPSPPRPTRLKVKRRNVTNLIAPTEQFLASVAAADLPLPTIEVATHASNDCVMRNSENLTINTSGFLAPQNFARSGSPPKTPMPDFSDDESSHRRPDWAQGSFSPMEEYFERPTSALSMSSDFSDDSFYSDSRISARPSDDGSCTSPESDITDPFQFPTYNEKSIKAGTRSRDTVLNAKLRSKTRKDAPWTPAMSAHLWSIYLVYLQDPTVTPFRIGASSVPPEGVCHRVAREAKRSWKGPKIQRPRIDRSPSRDQGAESRNHTPTAEVPKTWAQWPHSSAATRTHLRELCKDQGNTAVRYHHHLQSKSPTPFSKPNMFQTPEPSQMVSENTFNTQNIAMSLVTSTAASMQPDGPLAKLASNSELIEPQPRELSSSRDWSLDFEKAKSLGSPFASRTYGPSSSQNLNLFNQSRPSPPRTRSDTASGSRLRSPLHFEQPRSLNSTSKRRAQHALDEEMSPNGAVLRPSILNEQLFGTPFRSTQRRVRSRGFSLGDDALRHRVPGIFQHSPVPLPVASENQAPSPDPFVTAPAKLLPPPEFSPPRLGSPFTESGPSNTFPRRLVQGDKATIRRTAFATMHQTRRSIESFDFGEGPSLQSRLTHLDQKLAEIREREAASRRQRQQ